MSKRKPLKIDMSKLKLTDREVRAFERGRNWEKEARRVNAMIGPSPQEPRP